MRNKNELHYKTIRNKDAEKKLKDLQQYLRNNNLVLLKGEHHIEILERTTNKLLATSFVM